MKERWRRFVERIKAERETLLNGALVIPLTPDTKEFIEGLREKCQLPDYSSTVTAAFNLLAWAQDKVHKDGSIVAIDSTGRVHLKLDWLSLMEKARTPQTPFPTFDSRDR